jgi:tetratricopeptide (TPR) repeat protein
MKKAMGLFSIFVCLFLCDGSGLAQENWVEEVKVKAYDLVEKEKYDEAARMVGSAIDVAKQMYGETHHAVADLTTELGVISYLAGDVEKAEALLKQAIQIYERSSDPDPVFIGSIHIKLTDLFENQGAFTQAVFHMQQAISSYRKVADANDPIIVDLEKYLGRLSESAQSQGKEEEIKKQRETIDTYEPEKEKKPEKEVNPEVEKKRPLTKSDKSRFENNSFEILSVDCKEVFKLGAEGTKYPAITVTYRLHTTKNQANWTERIDVISPDGTIIYGGGGPQWYFSSQQDAQTYTVTGRSTEKKRGSYKFRIILEGENLKTEVIERSFQLQ